MFAAVTKKLVDDWQRSKPPVMLVHRTDDGSIRWVDVGAYLRTENEDRRTAVKQIVFAG
ncbi:MAG: hypothetical protein M2R45_03830 [Verrucomicrobia subdivision 3 bacterium]|nr:hypothetical protein [Limisphaerales bacterium]MCS1415786.1 hypothetical protein [Limisphaerales bacterium]